MTLKNVSEHPWVIGEDGHVPEYFCWCKRNAASKIEEGEANGISETSDPN
jgi:[calcium/calmodulin-dependent protein kinase] kinase